MNICKYSIYRKNCDPELDWDMHDFHTHNEFEIYLFHSGNCHYLIKNKVYHLQPNDLILLNGLTLHRANPLPTEMYERSVVHFSSEVMEPIITTLKFPELLKPFSTFNNCLFRDIDQKLLNQIEQSIQAISELSQGEGIKADKCEDSTLNCRFYIAKMQTLVIQLLFQIYELSQTHQNKHIHVETEKELHVRRITAWIDKHYQEDITLDHISKSLNVSKYYMSHIFKEVTGGTIMKFLMSCRLNHSKRLLETEPNLSVLDVALESGFKHGSHFSRYFLEKVGFTPLEYRKKYCNIRDFSTLSFNDQTNYIKK
ncbi:AraC family transcriptional regulator [Metabacillus bambusae]|uniref:Helix-turn-helix transcriptional regulator n=1 Tax=Metabacillus bambusae TaxID=2795218 RepID=A0ABS3MVR4_9BACI|nr:AraC family transcriptional regulator [Metabacillus bambusae]MBO1510091.1 helix-turn-helix transcriptional regulator [Metabacillus bambusae]